MNLHPKRRRDVTVEITPLIDVVFLLLIFFMVSTTFEHESEINITLPQASEDYSELKTDVVNVEVDVQGHVYVNTRPLVNSKLESIREALRDAALDMDKPTVIISADAEATHQLVIKVMDAARQLGLVNITFATQKIQEE